MKRWKKRAAIIGGGLAAVGIAAALVLNALNSNIALYVTPSEVAAGKAPKGQAFRIGGLVKCSPNTTKTTCHPRPNTRWTRPKKPSRR